MSDPNNKWDQPEAPPPPMFFGKKERDLVKQVNDELAERVIGQPIAYYPISLEASNFNDIYGEAIDKVSLPPVRVYAYVEVENEQTNDRYGYEYQTKLTVNFSQKRITADQNLYVRVGDFVQYGEQFYEIVRTYNDTRFYFGQVEHKFQISAECIRARTDSFRVMPATTRPGESAAVEADGSASPAPRPSPALPIAATYITLTPESRLTDGRYLAAGSGITLTDGGRQGPLTITSTAGAVALPANSVQYNSGGDFAGSANLTFNGTTLTGSYTGSLAELTTMSASLANLIPTSGALAGIGSYLGLDAGNNIIVTRSLGGGEGDGIFTTLNGSSAYVTSSLAIGGTTAPDHQVAISGSLSASVNISASAFYGDGSTLTGVTASAVEVADGPEYSLQFRRNAPVSGEISGSSALIFSSDLATLSLTGTLAALGGVSASSNISASAFYGDGANLTNLPAGGLIQAINGTQAYLTSSLAIGGSSAPDHTLAISGSVSASLSVSASTFHGDGAELTALTIGTAEDASYADGLFTDFATTTPVGTAVDRFNEILKALAPGPAPNLDDIDCNDTGVSAELSFGSSQSISGYTNVGTAAGFSAVDINGTYGTSTSSNNLRRGTFNGSRVIDGDLNEDVSADGVNYPANSFGDANLGNLVLEVNGSTLHTASMTDSGVGTGVPGSGTGTDVNGNGSGFTSLSQTGSAEFDDGTELDLFQHRTGKYKVVAADQREGWNYLRVVHTSSTFDRTTNYVAWVNDSNSSALTASSTALDTLSMSGDLRLSGVKYHTAGTAQYRAEVENAYRNVYTSTNISYTVTNGSISSVAMPSISVGSEDESKMLQLTGSLTVTTTSILNSNIAAGVNVAHPLKSNLSNGGPQYISGLLAYNRANNSTTTSETFRRENYRLDSGSLSSYAAQADVTDSGNAWNSTSSLLTVDGLLFYNQRLYSPIDSDVPNSGDFSAISNGPGSNVDYSGISGVRTFFRYFTNTGAASQTNFRITFTGDTSTRIVPYTTALSSTNIRVFVKLPTTSTAMSTGWLDLGSATANDAAQLNNFDGAYVGTPPAGGLEINSDTHEGTFVTQTVEQNENIVIKIVADAAWTGYISALSIAWGSS